MEYSVFKTKPFRNRKYLHLNVLCLINMGEYSLKEQYSIMFDQMMVANAGYFRISEVIASGIDRIHAYEWLSIRTDIEKAAKGLYVKKNIQKDLFYILSYAHKNVIFSHRSALYLNKISDVPVLKPDVTVKARYNVSSINKSCNVFQADEKYLDIGKIAVLSPSMHKVNCYDPERTVCDIIRKKSKMGSDVLKRTIRSYFELDSKDIKKLFEYAEIFGIKDKVLSYSEILN